MIKGIEVLREITIWSVLVRTFLAMCFGGILGYEREKKGRPAGLRTYMVVCVGSALAMMTGIYLTEVTGSGDGGRVAAQVISGIGFLGAGTILVTKQNQIQGLTTAAGLWAAACLGLAVGVGFYEGAAIGFAFIFLSLWVMQVAESRVRKKSRTLHLYVEFAKLHDIRHFLEYVRNHSWKVGSLDLNKEKAVDGAVTISATMMIFFDTPMFHEEKKGELAALHGVSYIEEL